MIKLTDLLKEEETFTATSKKSGETSVFKSKDSRDAAVKAGTHSKIKDKEDSEEEEPKGDKPNMFSKDTGYDAGDKKSEPSKSEPSKYDSKYFADSDGYSDKDDPNEPFYPDTDGSPSIGTKRTEIRLDKIETALDADLKLDNLGFKTARSSGAGGGQFEGPLEIIDKDADYDNGFTALSIGSGENDGNFSMGFLNQDGEPLFGDDSYSITPDDDISSEEAFELGKTLMKMPEVQKFLKGKISKDEFKPTYDKIQSKFSGKSEPKNESLSEGKSYQNRFKHLANIN
jgi:hypothetical protein